MIVYNITIKISPEIEKEWIDWQKKEQIADVMASGMFERHSFYRLLEQEESDGITYVIQYFASSDKKYKTYIEETAPLLRQKAIDRWGGKFITFCTLMEVVD